MLTFARLFVVLTLIAHVTVLILNGEDAAATPISQLSRGTFGWIHSVGLLTLGASWVLIGSALWTRDRGKFWMLGCILLWLSAAVLPYIAFYFASAPDSVLFGADANDPLAVLASILGVAMGAFQIELRRSSAVLAKANLTILILWLALVPVIPLLTTEWLGAYERTVGALMLVWTILLTLPGAAGPTPLKRGA